MERENSVAKLPLDAFQFVDISTHNGMPKNSIGLKL
jgi:hypothetical protein